MNKNSLLNQNYNCPIGADGVHNALKTGKDYFFAANANEIVAMMNPSPWGRKTVDTALVAAVGSDINGKFQTWGADTRLGNFKLQVRLMPFLMATRNFDSQVLTAIRNLTSSLGISLEEDGIILVAGFEVTTNATDWFWEGRRTAVVVTPPQGSMTTVHELTEGVGNNVVSIAVNSPTKQIWDSLRQGQTMLVMLPDAREPFLAMPFSLAGQAEAIDGFINYMRTDAKNLMDRSNSKRWPKKQSNLDDMGNRRTQILSRIKSCETPPHTGDARLVGL